MADKKKSREPDESRPKHDPYPDEPGQQPPRHDPRGREHEVHQEILERRMRGGRKPDPSDYRHALEQWKKLPGSVVRPPTDITAPPEEGSEPVERDNSKPYQKNENEPTEK
jgi:hypothetical protein